MAKNNQENKDAAKEAKAERAKREAERSKKQRQINQHPPRVRRVLGTILLLNDDEQSQVIKAIPDIFLK